MLGFRVVRRKIENVAQTNIGPYEITQHEARQAGPHPYSSSNPNLKNRAAVPRRQGRYHQLSGQRQAGGGVAGLREESEEAGLVRAGRRQHAVPGQAQDLRDRRAGPWPDGGRLVRD